MDIFELEYSNQMKKYIAEFIGTFFLVLTIVLSVNNGTPKGFAPLAIGLALTGLIYALGHISRAHFNPAVTLAFYLRRKFDKKDIAPYIVAQLIGAILATFIGIYLLNNSPEATIPSNPRSLDILPSMLAEIIGTCLLCLVILQVATTRSIAGNGYYGVAIGFTVTGLAYIFGPISVGAFNPAVGLSFCIAEMAAWKDFWIYLIAGILGALLSVFAFRKIYGYQD